MKPIQISFRNSPLSLTFCQRQKSRLPLDQENYKKVLYEVKKLVAEKKRNYSETKLIETLANQKSCGKP